MINTYINCNNRAQVDELMAKAHKIVGGSSVAPARTFDAKNRYVTVQCTNFSYLVALTLNESGGIIKERRIVSGKSPTDDVSLERCSKQLECASVISGSVMNFLVYLRSSNGKTSPNYPDDKLRSLIVGAIDRFIASNEFRTKLREVLSTKRDVLGQSCMFNVGGYDDQTFSYISELGGYDGFPDIRNDPSQNINAMIQQAVQLVAYFYKEAMSRTEANTIYLIRHLAGAVTLHSNLRMLKSRGVVVPIAPPAPTTREQRVDKVVDEFKAYEATANEAHKRLTTMLNELCKNDHERKELFQNESQHLFARYSDAVSKYTALSNAAVTGDELESAANQLLTIIEELV